MNATPDRAERFSAPLSADVMHAVAEENGVCVRPLALRRIETDTGRVDVVPVPCGSTIASVCAPCARKAQVLRMTQCRTGWHLDGEPAFERREPTEDQKALTATRADLVAAYRAARESGDESDADELREGIAEVDEALRGLGVRGKLPPIDPPANRTPKRSTKRRQDAPNLPRRKVEKRTVGRIFAGKYRPSMFVTLTLDTYGRVRGDGTPVDPDTYDYRRAARDAVHFTALVDRFLQNLRRCVGWEVQYFATVEPQKRGAPHLHAAMRGSIPHDVLKQVTAATYHQVWWPNHDEQIYTADRPPIWDERSGSFVDPDTRKPLPTWEDALDQVDEPAHVARFGAQVHSKGILGGTEEAGRHIGYLTKYLTKSVGEVLEAETDRQRAHADRLHDELCRTPCSPRCPVWLLYGVQPKGARRAMTPGLCKAKAHRRSTLALPGRRVLVSRKWSGKSLGDHKQERIAFVRQLLADTGQQPADSPGDQVIWEKTSPGDSDVPPRAHLLLHAVSQRIAWRNQYREALAAAEAHPPGDCSATERAA